MSRSLGAGHNPTLEENPLDFHIDSDALAETIEHLKRLADLSH